MPISQTDLESESNDELTSREDSINLCFGHLSQIDIDENNEIDESSEEFFSQQISAASITRDGISKRSSRTLSIPSTAFEQALNLQVGTQFEY
ncbi:hypothetical protein F8M41_019449 [Gigaspora margarita]|uniref:Uncharacterized protein n=1 Tax=Gigaspora margarita TaxID=4874 RepID=A0A8H4AJX3_GIGMA|nr:hypothetical protein F8M41_019449 [Gigaspora margarita]